MKFSGPRWVLHQQEQQQQQHQQQQQQRRQQQRSLSRCRWYVLMRHGTGEEGHFCSGRHRQAQKEDPRQQLHQQQHQQQQQQQQQQHQQQLVSPSLLVERASRMGLGSSATVHALRDMQRHGRKVSPFPAAPSKSRSSSSSSSRSSKGISSSSNSISCCSGAGVTEQQQQQQPQQQQQQQQQQEEDRGVLCRAQRVAALFLFVARFEPEARILKIADG
ncbi:hypothetical protein ACSSS7_006921 [Eimeria intestinalis]